MKYHMNGKDRGGFWGKRMDMVMDKMIPFQLANLEDQNPDVVPSHAIENFRIAAGLSKGEYYGMVFQDSDVGKWIEAAAYSLMLRHDQALEAKVDEIVDIIALAQQPDGYLNTYYTIKEPGNRWTNLAECHEMYCAGHLTEGAVAYHQATGKDKFLNVCRRMADHIAREFGPKAGQKRGYPGHPELELALMRLYGETGEKCYADLAAFFINERGTKPCYFEEETKLRGAQTHYGGFMHANPEYAQWHAPVREQKHAVGHAVRALYLYAGMAEVAAHTGDESLIEACERLWASAAGRQRYITGAYGAQDEGEAFSIDYELPNDTVYAETCASVAMVFFSQSMLRMQRDGKYADIIENALFNTVLSGTQLDGSRFFYCNPLEVVRGVSGVLPEYRSQLPERPTWYACACCPPNLARMLTSLPLYACEEREDGIAVHQYLDGEFRFDLAGGVTIRQESNYPWDGVLNFEIEPDGEEATFALHLRVPGWNKGYALTIDGEPLELKPEKGYLTISRTWKRGAKVTLTLEMPPRRMYANTRVREDAGQVALVRGPVVYCFESVDNEDQLHNLRIPRTAQVLVDDYDPELLSGIRTLSLNGLRVESSDDQLYSFEPPIEREVKIKAIPYYAWTNRGSADMRVWMIERA